ncbi:MAG: hypothetical protein HFI75_10825 [Lachnospiraceae bacterium]|nr:hypothetical protein [Lachnospiraceae bacterium]
MEQRLWLLCPVCGSKTRLRIRDDTIRKNFPLYCPKCKYETLVHVQQFGKRVLNILLYTFRHPVCPFTLTSLKAFTYIDMAAEKRWNIFYLSYFINSKAEPHSLPLSFLIPFL